MIAMMMMTVMMIDRYVDVSYIDDRNDDSYDDDVMALCLFLSSVVIGSPSQETYHRSDNRCDQLVLLMMSC